MQKKSFLFVLIGVIAITSMVLPLPTNAVNRLSDAQISAVVNLLQAFGADQNVVNNVRNSLLGLPTTSSAVSGTPTSSGISTIPVSSSGDSLSATLLSTEDDKAGVWGVFTSGPGAGGQGTVSPQDWNIKATLNLGTGKSIKSITLRQTNTEYWSTNNRQYFPLVVYNMMASGEGQKMTGEYTENLGKFTSGPYYLSIYAQKNTTAWVGGTLTVDFLDGTQVSANIPARTSSVVSPGYCAEDMMQCSNGLWVSRTGPSCQFVCPTTPTTPSSIKVLSPNGRETFKTGESMTIKWNSSGISSGKLAKIILGYKHYDTTYSSGQYFEDTIVSNVPNTGSYVWVIPEFYSKGVYPNSFSVKVVSEDGYYLDYSDAEFTILSGNDSAVGINITSPISGDSYNKGQKLPISWSSSSNQSQPYSINLLRKNDLGFNRIIFLNYGSWVIPSNLQDGSDYYIRVTEGPYRSKTGYSGPFSITGSVSQPVTSMTVLTPTNSYGVSSFSSGENVRFNWSLPNRLGAHKITLESYDSNMPTVTVLDVGETGFPITNNYYDWKVPTNIASGKYTVKVQMGRGNDAVYGKSAGHVTLVNNAQVSNEITVNPSRVSWGDRIIVSSPSGRFASTQNEGMLSGYGSTVPLGLANSSDGKTVTYQLPSTKYYDGEYKLYVTTGNMQNLGPANVYVYANSPVTQSQTTATPVVISVITPVNQYGVSTFRAGESVRFQWSMQNLLGIRKITLIPADSMGSQTTVVDTGDTGFPISYNYYNWVIPSTVTNGKYYIEVQRGSGGTALVGRSVGYITINNQTVSTTETVSTSQGVASINSKLITVSPTSVKWGDKITVTNIGGMLTSSDNEATVHSSTGGVISLGYANSSDKKTVTFQLPSTKYATGEYKLYVTNGNLVDLGPVSLNISEPVVVTPPTLSVSLLSTSEDKAGSWSVFAPGTYGSLSPSDWNLSATLNLPTTKYIKSISLNLVDATGLWSTNSVSNWPLVVIEGDRQLASSYVNTLGYFGSGVHNWKVYAQKNSNTWPGGKLVVTFDDNTVISAEIPASSSNMTSNILDGLKSINPSLYR